MYVVLVNEFSLLIVPTVFILLKGKRGVSLAVALYEIINILARLNIAEEWHKTVWKVNRFDWK